MPMSAIMVGVRAWPFQFGVSMGSLLRRSTRIQSCGWVFLRKWVGEMERRRKLRHEAVLYSRSFFGIDSN